MSVRNAADHRTLVWAFVLFPIVPIVGYVAPHLAPWLVPLGLYLAYCAGIFTHNHNHCPVFADQRANRAYAVWLSFFYGAPIFTWIPTHNQNHHRFVNGEGDATRTTRHGSRNTLWKALSYPFFSTIWSGRSTRLSPRRPR
jgi:fatty acid desaturase